jgi:hypothetical protein
MSSEIISLQETSANNWLAKYRGNYGTYSIRIKIDGKKITEYSCSCPSDYSPCKHINIIKDAIDNRIDESSEDPVENGLTVETILKNIPPVELRDFIVRHAKYDPQLTNKILLEFANKSGVNNGNNYAMILRKALKKVHFDYDDLYDYHDSSIEIDILDELLAKAKEHIARHSFDEAVAICKACIEEYASWMEDVESDIIDYIDPAYQEEPFELLREAALSKKVNSNELFNYCFVEMQQSKYSDTQFFDSFNNLLKELATTDNAAKFINLQDALLNKITNPSSHEAEKIISRKIEFYKNNNQLEIAKQLVADNIQIESFRKQVVEQKIAERKFLEAKKLIADFLSVHHNNEFHYHREWNELILTIAQKEKDIPLIRKTAFAYIENYFQEKYYRIYKTTYSKEEWAIELENIIRHYEKNEKYFSDSIADVLAAEKDAERLMKYIEKHLSVEKLEAYRTHFVSSYPNETLTLFRKAIVQYAEKNTGRSTYEYIVSLFKIIARIEGGKEVITALINQFKIQYKNRRAMMEIFNKVTI